MTIRVRPEHFAEYKRHHAADWPEVLATISRCHIRNYSIYHRDFVLYAYFEYWGTDFAADMQLMAADPATQRWWDICMPCQRQTEDAVPGEWWTPIPEIFHCD